MRTCVRPLAARVARATCLAYPGARFGRLLRRGCCDSIGLRLRRGQLWLEPLHLLRHLLQEGDDHLLELIELHNLHWASVEVGHTRHKARHEIRIREHVQPLAH